MVKTTTMKSKVISNEVCVSSLTISLGDPITVSDGKANFNKEVMELGKWYPFEYKDETYLAVKTSDKIIDIYKVRK